MAHVAMWLRLAGGNVALALREAEEFCSLQANYALAGCGSTLDCATREDAALPRAHGVALLRHAAGGALMRHPLAGAVLVRIDAERFLAPPAPRVRARRSRQRRFPRRRFFSRKALASGAGAGAGTGAGDGLLRLRALLATFAHQAPPFEPFAPRLPCPRCAPRAALGSDAKGAQVMLVLAPEAARAGLWAVVDVTRASARDNFALSMAQALEPLLSGAFPRVLRGLTIYGPAPRVGNGWLAAARLLVPRFLAGGAEAVSYADAAEHSVWSDARLCAFLRIPVPVEARWRALAVAFVSHTRMARTASASTLAPSRAPSALSRTASLLSRAGSGALVLSRTASRFSRPRHPRAPRQPRAPRPPRAPGC